MVPGPTTPPVRASQRRHAGASSAGRDGAFEEPPRPQVATPPVRRLASGAGRLGSANPQPYSPNPPEALSAVRPVTGTPVPTPPRPSGPPVPRPRTFNPDDALAAALDVFHAKGYEAASVQDLVDATGLSRSSLYATFGDKHALYLAALDRYTSEGRRRLADRCGCGSPLDSVRAHLESIAEGPEGAAPPLGCLMTNAAAERASRDPETARRAAAARLGMTDVFERTVREAQAAGEVGAGRDVRALAHFLTGAVYGLHGLQKAGAEAGALAAVVDQTMAAVEG